MTEKSNEKKHCFVIMPISDVQGYETGHFGRVYEYIIKPAVLESGYHPIRSDDTTKTDYIAVDIIQKIVNSEFLICDLSAKNSNVMYELGIAHAFNKKVVLIKDNATDKVFDVQGLRHYEYDKSLRVDTVDNDISRITQFILEICNAEDNSLNSIIKLAGLKTAEPPKEQKISADTELIMLSMASLEDRIYKALEDMASTTREERGTRYFRIRGDKVFFNDGSSASLKDKVYDENHDEIGTLLGINKTTEYILIGNNERVIRYSPYSVRSKGMTGNPF